MLRCRSLKALVWSTSVLLTVGCAATHTRPARTTQAPSKAAAAPVDDSKPDPAESRAAEAHAHYAQGLIYDFDDNADEALSEFSKAAVADPANEDLVLEVTRRYLQRREPEKALGVLTNAIAVRGASGAIYARLGLVYSRLGDEDKAIKAAETAIQRAPDSLAGYQNLFLIHLQKGRTPEALKALDAAAKAPSPDAEFLINLGELYANFERQAPSEAQKANAGASAVFKRAEQMHPTAPRLLLRLADGYRQAGDSTNATRLYTELLDRYQELPALRDDIRPKLADIYISNNDSEKATEQLKAIVRDDPANSRAYYLLGHLAYAANQLTNAVECFHRSLLLDADFKPAYYELADAQILMDDSRGAIATLQNAAKKFGGGDFTSEFLLARACSRQKDYAGALTHFTAAEVVARTSAPSRLNGYFYFEEGATCERKGDFEQAQKCFEKSLQLDPEFAEALNYFGYMLADRGVQLDKARELIEKAVKLEPKNPAYVDSLGWVLFKLKHSDEALVQIQRAISLSPEADPTLFDHLGDIYASLNQPEKALEAWRKSLSLEPNDDIRKKLVNFKGK